MNEKFSSGTINPKQTNIFERKEQRYNFSESSCLIGSPYLNQRINVLCELIYALHIYIFWVVQTDTSVPRNLEFVWKKNLPYTQNR